MCVAHHSKVYNTQAIKLILRSKELGLHHFNPDRFEHAKRRCLRLSEPEGPVPKSQVQLDQKLEAQLERRGNGCFDDYGAYDGLSVPGGCLGGGRGRWISG
ncbi:hypothetical protein PC129_g18053 [Phytophthora cactorum]|uniref:Uncharacterized protein n=1 Tax=Phytophthora cactorum TaxID=29920 RepID=A0A8T1E1G0_9STRA|nr:hypothetical protein Pcac1_g6449 [Phytophthora cactorum]KAG2815414.1 hypothetical protein PC112_g13883 [Phytophthora cactorum]KAG2817201.1 hypothetical protein PC111_g12789 [Phytophthora cactorum]KAG2853405.1 hypothetical protein PC113_g14193 [Phytophthora cactorum]KAG2896363.1 hypothetical protein PC114_g15105 [Phytophthora cactorum]